jgi:AMMECR1 domain-containing protein
MLFKLPKAYLHCAFCVILVLVAVTRAQAALPGSAADSSRSAAPTTTKIRLAQHKESESQISLADVVKQTMAIHFGERKLAGKTIDQFAAGLPVPEKFHRPAGVFVTLSYKGKSRACWGTINPSQESIVKQTVYATLDALTKEYRYPKIKTTEWKTLKPQITVITGVEPISNIAFQNPLRDGLLVRSGGKAGVYLPGEAADAHYQLVQCKLKAGIKSGEPFQLYRLRTEIYE